MSTEFTVALSAPEGPLGGLLIALETALVDRCGLRHDGRVLRCAWQPDIRVFDEVSPRQELGPAKDVSELARDVASWAGFATEFWNDKMLLYVLVARVERPEGAYVDAWVTITTSQLERLARDGELRAFHAAIAEVARAVGSAAGYGHFELTFEPLPPERAEQAIVDLPDYPGEAATIGVLSIDRASFAELERDRGQTFDVVGTTAGYWILSHRELATWLGAT